MKRTLHIDLETLFGLPVATLPIPFSPLIKMAHAVDNLYSNSIGTAVLQSFDGLLGYINMLDLRLAAAQTIHLQASRADLHIFYFLQGKSPLEIRDIIGQQCCIIHPSRARYFYLPAGDYEIQLPAGDTAILNFYFRHSIFRDGNERPFRFLHPLIDAHRQASPRSGCSIDFRVGPRTISRLRYLCQHLKKGDFDNDQFIYRELTELIKLSRDKIFEEYEQRVGSSEEAMAIYHEMERLIRIKGQEFRIDELCESFSKSKQYLGRIFKKKYKQSLQESRRQLLIKLIKEQIILIQSPTDTAYACGFNSLHHFSKFFKNEIGLSPSEYLAALGKPD